MKQKSIGMEFANIANSHTETNKRNANALNYITNTARKNQRKRDTVIATVGIITAVAFLSFASWFIDGNDTVSATETETTTIENGVAMETNPVYMICDVVDIEFTYDYTVVSVVLPNGEIHDFTAIDTPDEFDEVVIKANNQDDYNTYELVGLR